MEAIFAIINPTYVVVEIGPEKSTGLQLHKSGFITAGITSTTLLHKEGLLLQGLFSYIL